MSSSPDEFYKRSKYFSDLLNMDPVEAVRQALEIDIDSGTNERFNLMVLRAATLVDGGALTHQQSVIEEGIALFRHLYALFPTPHIAYNLANGLIAATAFVSSDGDWLSQRESTRERREEARRFFWKAANDADVDFSLRTQAWTNLANQFSASFRLGEAHDSWLAALEIDPENGVAASSAARNLLWLHEMGGCSDLAHLEACMLAKIADRNQDRVAKYVGAQAAKKIAFFAKELDEVPPRSLRGDPFVDWVERERLTLAPVAGLVDHDLVKLDWLMLPRILERESFANGMPPPVFAMFNMLKSDFILARDLLWRSIDESAWPRTGRFSDTLDYAVYGPDASALILAHRTALDLLDKVAATANHYFELGRASNNIYFRTIWREIGEKNDGFGKLSEKVEKLIGEGVYALYGLVELADDYARRGGILNHQKSLRNAGTHRFVVLHDLGDPTRSRRAVEVEHHRRDIFIQEVLRALRVSRSAIQMLVFSVSQHEKALVRQLGGLVGSMVVPDHDLVRGHKNEE
jgi:tetratricopeptide (TPR) repeat protein